MKDFIIRLVDVQCRLGNKWVLKGLDLTVKRGEIIAVVGLSGTGKSTLLKVIAGLIPIQGGKVIVFGEDLSHLNERALNERVRSRMGFVFQEGALFDWLTVADNVAFPLWARERKVSEAEIRERVKKLLGAVGLNGTELFFPPQLSGGMRKRVALARALADNPQLVLYDEPTSGLDPVMSGVINDLIVQMRDRFGVTEVIVTHDLPNATKFADRIAMLHEGRIIAEAKASEFPFLPDPIVQQFVRGTPTGPLTDFLHRHRGGK